MKNKERNKFFTLLFTLSIFGVCSTVIYAAQKQDTLIFVPEPIKVVLAISHERTNQKWSVYMPTQLLPTDSFKNVTNTITLHYKDSTWFESTVPFPIDKQIASSVRLFEDHHALWAPFTKGGEVEFRIYHTYVLVQSTVLSKTQLIEEVNSESPAGG